jgi:sugar lactone lactonase YvrE
MQIQQRLRYCLLTFFAGVVVLILTPVALAHPATGIVVDRKSQVYFSDLETIWKLDTNRKLSVFRPGVSGRHVHELAIDDQDNIYGEDISYEPATKKWISDVWKMTPSGALTYIVAPTTDPPRALTMWRDRDGNTYFIDQNNHLKQRTILLRRTPDGKVTTFAGGSYGHRDGKGTDAQFSSVGGLAFGADGSLYLTDGVSLRKVTMDGTVTTVATNLNVRTSEDKPVLFEGLYGSLAGLTVDANGVVFLADAGNRRLLKINPDGKVEVALRADPPFFPNGAFATPSGDVYVLEVGFTLPNISSGPRVRKITPDGKNVILTVVGQENGQSAGSAAAQRLGLSLETGLGFFVNAGRKTYGIIALTFVVMVSGAWVWRSRRRRQTSR